MEIALLENYLVAQIILILPYVAFLGVIALLMWNIMLEWRLRRLTRGTRGENLEQHIATINKDYQEFVAFKQQMHEQLHKIDERVKGSVRGIGVIRFNPFAARGTIKPSFAAAFLSEKDDGLVISTLHARDSVSIFSKNIVAGMSEQELTEEEHAALEKARNSLHSVGN